ncbi:MAG TPA: helix-turn-helix transcriptional regulator [Terriglobales bacterium]|nr:helix-turn-helix transcriptional regulator [Terriglobales bacterium]
MKELSSEQLEYAVSRFVSICQSREITQTELERLSQVNQSTISKIMRPQDGDKYTPSKEVLQKLFMALGFRLENILTESEHLADEIVGYLATPLTGLSRQEDVELRRVVESVRAITRDDQFTNPSFDVYWPGDHTHPEEHAGITAQQVYVTDRSRASTNDFIILFCGSPSYGVGQENEIATQAGVPAIRLVPPEGLSRMMLGSFIRATDIPYSGNLKSRVEFDETKLREALKTVRQSHFRNAALFRGMNGDGFGKRLRTLIDDRCNADYVQFAADIGVSLLYLHKMMDEPFLVPNPSARLLKRMAHRLGERVAFLLGEAEENDPIWTESNASWRSWVEKNEGLGLDAAITLRMRDDWRHSYAMDKREQQSSASFRKSTGRMREADWDKQYTQRKKGTGDAKQPRLL